MRILQVITDRDRRGAQVFAVDLATGMASLGAAVNTVALTRGRHGDLLRLPVLGSSRYALSTLLELRRQAKRHDVVIAHGSSTLLACAVGLIGTKVPFVYRQISDPLHWAASWRRRLRVGVLLRRSRAVVVLSSSVADLFGRHYRVQRTHMTVIPNAVPAGSFWPPSIAERTDARRRFALAEDAFVAVYIGALAVEKGADMAVRSVADLSDGVLLVVGDGPERAALEQVASEVAEGRVQFTGSLTSPLDALHAADVLLLPSRAGDSMPAVLIEAGLCGVPSITTPVGAITDVVVDGVTGKVVPTGDQSAVSEALARWARNEEARATAGRAAIERCRNRFTIEATAPQWMDLLGRVTQTIGDRDPPSDPLQPQG